MANGRAPQKSLAEQQAQQHDLLIAADGGANICREYAIRPDVIIGDLDSVHPQTLADFRDVRLLKNMSQENSDLEKTLDFAATHNPISVTVLGGVGNRLDHSLANLFILQSANYNFEIKFIDDFGTLTLIRSDFEIPGKTGSTVSFFSFSPVSGVRFEGFRYPLKKSVFPNGISSLSNVVETSPAWVRIGSGSIFYYSLHE